MLTGTSRLRDAEAPSEAPGSSRVSGTGAARLTPREQARASSRHRVVCWGLMAAGSAKCGRLGCAWASGEGGQWVVSSGWGRYPR